MNVTSGYSPYQRPRSVPGSGTQVGLRGPWTPVARPVAVTLPSPAPPGVRSSTTSQGHLRGHGAARGHSRVRLSKVDAWAESGVKMEYPFPIGVSRRSGRVMLSVSRGGRSHLSRGMRWDTGRSQWGHGRASQGSAKSSRRRGQYGVKVKVRTGYRRGQKEA